MNILIFFIINQINLLIKKKKLFVKVSEGLLEFLIVNISLPKGFTRFKVF